MQISSQLKNKWHTQILKNVIEEKGQQKTKYNGKMTKYSRKNMDRRVADLGSDSTLDSRLQYNLPTLILPFVIHSINMKCLPWAKYHAKGVALCPLSPSQPPDSAYVEVTVHWVTQARMWFPHLFIRKPPTYHMLQAAGLLNKPPCCVQSRPEMLNGT